MLGERLDAADFDSRGLVGDRLYAVEDTHGKFGSGKTTRRFRRLPGLFDYRAWTAADETRVALPDGRTLRVGSRELDDALSERYGEELHVTPETSVSHFDAGAVHILTTATLRRLARELPHASVAVARFRPNLLLDLPDAAPLERAWLGAELRVEGCVLRVASPTERCVMVNAAQDDLPRARTLLRDLARVADLRVGVYARVVEPGTMREGDAVTLTMPSLGDRAPSRPNG